MIKIIEIDLLKLERGLREGKVKVTRGGKTFYRRQRVGRKEEPKKELVIEGLMIPGNIEEVAAGLSVGIEGSMHEDDLFIVNFKDKTKGIYKAMAPPDIIGEVGYYEVSKILDVDICPETVKVEWDNDEGVGFGQGEGSCQRWISDAKELYSSRQGIKINSSHHDDLAKIFVQDMVVGCNDRHVGNVVVSEGKCYAIDSEDWGTQRSKEAIAALNAICEDVDEPVHDVMLDWMRKSMDESQFKEFRERVMVNAKVLLEKKDNIFGYYNQYFGDDEAEVDDRIGSVESNIEELEKILKVSR